MELEVNEEHLMDLGALDPEDYFSNLKSKVQNSSDEFLDKLYANTQALVKKSHALGQTKVTKKLLYTLEVLSKERELFNLGFNSFVYRDDIEYYMDKVSDKAVKIIELEEYPREIPDEVAEKLITLKKNSIFDAYYVVFTDYTGKTEREVQAERKRKDPILFGAFCKRSQNSRFLHDRFYYIADWEDEYCDLTLDKMVSEMSKQGKNILNPVCIPDAEIQTIREYMNSLEEDSKTRFRVSSVKKKSFFERIKFWS